MELVTRLSENPEAVAELTREELEQARTELKAAGKAYVEAIKSGESEDKKADLAAANEAAELLTAVQARLDEYEAEDKEISDGAEELETAFAQEEEDEGEGEEDTDPEAPAEEPEPEAEPEAEPVEEETTEPTEEPEAIAAAKKPSMGAIAKRVPKARRVPEPVGIVAAAGPMVRGDHPHGLRSPLELGESALAVWNSFGRSAKVDAKALVASFDTSHQYPYEVTGDVEHDGPVVDAMLKEIRGLKTPEALTAAATFCAPAQPLYDYFSIAERAGLLDLPTLNASRGRITYRTSPSYASVLANVDWAAAVGQVYTAEQAGSGASKVNFAIVCPDTVTCEVDAYPVILEFGNFTDRFDPETVANAIENSMIFHDHFMNAQHIQAMITASTAQGAGDTGGGGLVNVANVVGFLAAKYRDTFRMSPTAVLELVFPAWVVDALVADLVARNATTSFENARARVLAEFASLNLRVQAVQDWDSIGDNDNGGWPQAADMLLYAPGTFVRLDGGSLDFGIVRDSTLNATNIFQTFSESFETVCEIGHDSWLLDGVTICPRGSAGLDVALDCNPGFGS